MNERERQAVDLAGQIGRRRQSIIREIELLYKEAQLLPMDVENFDLHCEDFADEIKAMVTEKRALSLIKQELREQKEREECQTDKR